VRPYRRLSRAARPGCRDLAALAPRCGGCGRVRMPLALHGGVLALGLAFPVACRSTRPSSLGRMLALSLSLVFTLF